MKMKYLLKSSTLVLFLAFFLMALPTMAGPAATAKPASGTGNISRPAAGNKANSPATPKSEMKVPSTSVEVVTLKSTSSGAVKVIKKTMETTQNIVLKIIDDKEGPTKTLATGFAGSSLYEDEARACCDMAECEWASSAETGDLWECLCDDSEEEYGPQSDDFDDCIELMKMRSPH